jgi:hypothetical protein
MEKQPAVILTREKPRVNGMLDLQAVPHAELWERIAPAVERLDQEHGSGWRLKILVRDTPEAAAELPRLVARFHRAGLRHDSVREPGGGQGMIVAPAPAGRNTVPVAA